MKLLPSRKAAEVLGVHPNTLRKWADAGDLKHVRTPSGQRLYDVDSFVGEVRSGRKICYCRVSSYKQKEDLTLQIEFMRSKYPKHEIISDIGSGLNFKRKGLRAVLESAIKGDVQQVVVAHKDRLSRFGHELIRWIIENHGGKLLVLDDIKQSPEQELTRDLLTILHVFSCRLHGLRNYRNTLKKDQDLPER
ncbi:MAG: IS607 family transposase [Magnetococcus sp. YQC-5]